MSHTSPSLGFTLHTACQDMLTVYQRDASPCGGLLRSYERSERVYAAMQARGYDGELRLLWDRAWRLTEMVVAVALVLYMAGVQVYARY